MTHVFTQAAQQAIVLLKNEDDILPLDESKYKGSNGMKIAMIGPHFNATTIMLSENNYHGSNVIVNTNSPYQSMQRRGVNLLYALGCDIICNTSTGLTEAVNASKQADVALVYLGLHPGQGDNPAREDDMT